MPVTELTDATFDAWLGESELPALIDFWAPWCVPCKKVTPIVRELADELSARMRVGSLDIDANPRTAVRYDILSIPTLLLVRDGRPVARVVGARSKDAIIGTLSPHLT